MNEPGRHVLDIRPRESLLDKRAPHYEATLEPLLLMDRLQTSSHPPAPLKRSVLAARPHSVRQSGTGRCQR